MIIKTPHHTVSSLPCKHTTHGHTQKIHSRTQTLTYHTRHHRHEPGQIPKPRSTYTHTQLASTFSDRAPKRQNHKAALCSSPTPPQLPSTPCLRVPSLTWKEGAQGGEKMRGRSAKNKQNLHPVCLSLQICEMNLSQRRMWRENSCKASQGNLTFL